MTDAACPWAIGLDDGGIPAGGRSRASGSMRIGLAAAGLVLVGVVGLAGCSSGSTSDGASLSTTDTSPTHEQIGTAWVPSSYRWVGWWHRQRRRGRRRAGVQAAGRAQRLHRLRPVQRHLRGRWVVTVHQDRCDDVDRLSRVTVGQESSLLQLLPQVARTRSPPTGSPGREPTGKHSSPTPPHRPGSPARRGG